MINKLIANTIPYMPKKLVWIFSQRYVAGESIDDGIQTAARLNTENMLVTIDILGEFITNLEQAEQNKLQYLAMIDNFSANKIKGGFSVKPTSFGLLLDEETCYRNIREVVQKAASINHFVRIDMEDSGCTTKEIDLYSRLFEEFPNHVGLVFQAYLKRTLDDVLGLIEKYKDQKEKLNFRLCKGIYVEPSKIAYKDFHEVRKNFLRILDAMLSNKVYPAIATHDKYLVEEAYELLEKHQTPKDRYEFQMLYGVTPSLRDSIIEKGHAMRIYVPFGKDWFGYCSRRIKENPKMANDIIKAIFIRG